MMKTYLIFLWLFLSGMLFSQTIPSKGKSIGDFVPANWKIFQQAEGDLNKDEKPDAVLIIENTNPDLIFVNEDSGNSQINLNSRYLLILFQTDNGYELMELNKTFLPSEGNVEEPCLIDPLMEGGIEIKKGSLLLTLNYWSSCGSWTTNTNIYTFRFQKDEFELIGFDTNEFHRATGETTSTSINFSTKKMSITTGGNLFEDEAAETQSTEKTEWKNFQLTELKNLKTLKVPMEWEWMGCYI